MSAIVTEPRSIVGTTPADPTSRRVGRLWKAGTRYPRLAIFGAVIASLILVGVFAPLLAPYDPLQTSPTQVLAQPSRAHLLGTDNVGRDQFSRVIYGARIALVIGTLADGIAVLLGVLLGVVAGYFGGRVDAAIMRSVDVMLAFPYLLLAMIVVAILGPSLTNAMIAIGIVYTPQFARLVRGAVLGIRGQEFVEAAGAVGAGAVRILGRHVLPNVLSPIIVLATLTVGFTIVETAGLSFLGLGATPPTPEWGSMLATGRSFMLTAPWIATFPGLAILVTVVGFNLVGDGLRDLLDPRLRGRS